ncbi:efflux RND transporter periplasmic adaptor subunit [Aliidiomarina sedimenti]|uniref:Efflux RND transporter periplasmic adaptor subunit n=1 Tax=Aliidiomarina sedimenti TaxID=1933879 RepID=A0ABY0C1M2_9GAMM|nr:efflux RND transporter periplasmic adaptor subunit [Aliidiomarina sedimenti]RUO31472.1 efflux RND transporter periplasmic adaptor subunit [Aliidiomarina sedimenti]
MRAYPLPTLLLAFCLPLLSACQNSDASTAADVDSEQQTPALPVETHEVDRATLYARFSTTGVLEAREEADVVARVNGVIEEILVEEGDFVERGQILATLESERFEQARLQAAAELRGVEQELARLQQMAQQQLASADAVERLQANRDTLKARLRLTEIDLESATIRAPISGYIANRYAKTGNLIQQHERHSLFNIIDLDLLETTLHVPERDLAKVRSGQRVELQLQGIADTVTGEVARISPAVDSVAGTFRVTVQINNPEHQLKSGMFARAQINYAQHDDTLRIPHYALLRLDSQSYVYVMEDGLAKRRQVTPGLRDGEWVEITDGLAAGSQVVVTGQTNLTDNSRIVSVNL